KIRNWAFQYEGDEQGFVDYILSEQPEPPKYFATMKHLNKVNRPLLVEVPKHPKLSNEEILSAHKKGMKNNDTRDKLSLSEGYVSGRINSPNGSSLRTWAGWTAEYEE